MASPIVRYRMVHCMEPYQVLLLILVLVAFLYLVLLVYVFGKMHEFKVRLRDKLQGINLLLYERTDALLRIFELFRENLSALGEPELEYVKALKSVHFEKPKEDEVRRAMETVKAATSYMRYFSQPHPNIKEDPRFLQIVEFLDDLERSFRTLMLQYNADVTAYNYWIRIPTTRWFAYIIGYRKKLPIS